MSAKRIRMQDACDPLDALADVGARLEEERWNDGEAPCLDRAQRAGGGVAPQPLERRAAARCGQVPARIELAQVAQVERPCLGRGAGDVVTACLRELISLHAL